MFFSRLNYFGAIVLGILFLDGCVGNVTYKTNDSFLSSTGFYGVNKKSESEIAKSEGVQEKVSSTLDKKSLFAKEVPSSFFLLEPNLETWKSYYYFFRVRKKILKDLPKIVPESEYDIPVVLNDRVRSFLGYFQTTGHDSLNAWLSRSGKYIPMMKEILEEKGLPLDLVYLAMIESGFNVRARSNKGAVGPWQFIESTAKRYGLRVDYWVDERIDPEKSTQAAANYLRDLYDMFESWELAAAGYNAGEDTVKSAIEKFKVSDFWEISEYTLPDETKDYVPKLIAALIIAKNPEKYGFTEIEYQKPEPYEKVSVPPQRSLKNISRISGIGYERLSDLNPSLIRGSIPPGDIYEINVPVGYKEIVVAKYDEIDASGKVVVVRSNSNRYKVRRGDSLGSRRVASKSNPRNLKAGKVILVSNNGSVRSLSSQKSDNKNIISYRVKKGDTIWDIASRYDVAVSDLKKWNKLRSTKLVAGNKLRIYME
jgi:peptidoglycan lytic transglycosylase D